MDSTPIKKRKQASGSQTEPKAKMTKAVKFDDRPIAVSIESNESSEHGLIFAQTPGVEPPTNLSFAAYQSSGGKRRKLYLHSETHPRLDFKAPSVSRHTLHGKDRHYVGIYNPETSELKLVPAKVVTMKSELKKTFTAGLQGKESEEDTEASQSHTSKRTALGEEFGTKKAKKALKSAAANAVATPMRGQQGGGPMPVTAMTEAVVLSARDAEDVEEGPTKNILKDLVESAHPRPKPDLDASVPADIYSLNSLVPGKDRQHIDVSGWISAIENDESITTTSRYVSHRVVRIAEQKDEMKLKALKYLLALIYWINALVPKGKSGMMSVPQKEKVGMAMPGIDSATRESITRKFTPKDSFRLSPWDVNKIMLHTCAIAVVLDDCISEAHDLQEDLKLTSKQIKQYYQELGCKVTVHKDDKDQQLVKLQLPFSLPEVRQRRVVRR